MRAFAGANLAMRFHFNLLTSFAAGNLLSVSFDPLNLLSRATHCPPGMGDVAQLFADEVIAFQIMMGTHQFAEAQALGFVIAEGAHFDEGQELLLSEGDKDE